MSVPSPAKKSFISTFLGDRHVAAISASGPFLMRRLLRAIDAPNTKLLVELGPGDGVAAKALLPFLPSDARYVAVERNPDFVAALRSDADPRETIIEGVAQDLEKHMPDAVGRADAVIASIPFTYLTQTERRELAAAAKRLLRPGGIFIVFHQYTWNMLPVLRAEFGNASLQFEPLNVMPCFLMKAVK